MAFVVSALPYEDVLDVRLDVLRRGTPSADPSYSEDADSHAVHLGIRLHDRAVATSSWYLRPFPGEPDTPALQLKGMAVRDDLQGTGAGKALIEAGIGLARAKSCRIVWARARDSALYFYERIGFTVVGDAFVDEATGMSHHFVMRRL